MVLLLMVLGRGGWGVSLAEGGVVVVWGVVGGGLSSLLLLLPSHPQQVPLQLLLQAGRQVTTVQPSERYTTASLKPSASEREVTTASLKLSFLHYSSCSLYHVDQLLCLFL